MSGEDLHLQTSPTESKTRAKVNRTSTKNATIASATNCARRKRTALPMTSPPAALAAVSSTSSLAGRCASLGGSNPGGEDLMRLYKLSLLDELAMNQSPGTNNLLGGHLLRLNQTSKIATPTFLGTCAGVGPTEKSVGSPTLDPTSSVMGSLKMLDQLILSGREASIRRQMELLQRIDALGFAARHYAPLPTSITSPLNLSSTVNFAGNRAISNQPYDILSNALVSNRNSGGTSTTIPVSQGGEKGILRQLDDARTARRPPRVLYMQSDNDSISPYQCLVRKQIEIFEATEEDTSGSAQGRNRPIVLGQVGIRCVHCGKQSNKKRTRGSVYFPSTMLSTYQTAQNMANCHLAKECTEIPRAIREDIIRIRLSENGESKNTRKSAFGGGRKYWASGLVALGIEESADRRLRYSNKNREL